MALRALRWRNFSGEAPTSSAITQDQWDQHQGLLKHLYLEADMTLEAVMEYMRLHHNFNPSKHQFTLKLASWGYYKYQVRNRSHSLPFNGVAENASASAPFAADGTCTILADSNPYARENSPLVSEDEPLATADLSGCPIQCISKHGMQPLASEAGKQTEPQKSTLDLNASRSNRGEQSTSTDLHNKDRGIPVATLSRFSLSTISESNKDDQSIASFVHELDRNMLHDTSRRGTAFVDERDDLPLFEMNSIITTESDQSGETIPTQLRLVSALSRSNSPSMVAEHEIGFGESGTAHTKRPSSEKRSVPPALLSANASIRPIGLLLPSDLIQVNNLAKFFSVSGAADLAFRIHHIVLDHVLAILGKDQVTPQLLRLAIDTTRTATTSANYSVVTDLVRNNISKRSGFLSLNAPEACVLHSYLGSSFLQRKHMRAAYQHCRLALERYQSVPREMQNKRAEIILATHCRMVLQAKVPRRAAIDLESGLAAFHGESDLTSDFSSEDGRVLEKLQNWSKLTLVDNDFVTVMEEVPADLLEKAPTSKDIEQLGMTILFWCFCVRYWREEHDSEAPSSTAGARGPLAYLQTRMGIEAHDSLFTMAVLLFDRQPSDCERKDLSSPSLVRYTLGLTMQAYKASPVHLDDFFAAYASRVRTGCRPFSTELYQSLVRDYLLAFTESRVVLKLSECAFRDPRFRPRPPPIFLPPSTTVGDPPLPPPTMLSTPRSSWSGFAAMASLTKRNTVPRGNAGNSNTLPTAGLRLSTGSSSFRRRFSFGGSSQSFRGSSAMDVDSVDCVMEE